jgi:hypothetical protein
MKYFLILLIVCTGCDSEQQAAAPQSIVDSNTIESGDSTPAILYLDNFRKDTSVHVTLDSMGPSVDAADTVRVKQ